MRKLFFSTLLALSFFSVSIFAQGDRLQTLADKLQQNTNELAESAYDNFTKKSNNNRNEIETLLNAQQLNASVTVLKRMVQDRRQNSELRDVTNAINDIVKRVSNNAGNTNLWREVQANVKDISQEISSSGENNNKNNKETGSDGNIVGNVNWSGTVDHDVKLIIHGNTIEVQTLSGKPYTDATFSFTSPLPNRNSVLEVEKRTGRGSVQILQQPSKSNDYTAIIRILDKDGGAKLYELEIYWK